jgi:hypothetical protein
VSALCALTRALEVKRGKPAHARFARVAKGGRRSVGSSVEGREQRGEAALPALRADERSGAEWTPSHPAAVESSPE